MLKLYKLVLPRIWQHLRKHWVQLAMLVVFGVSSGAIPAIKSELESGFLEQVSDLIRKTTTAVDMEVAKPRAAKDILNLPLNRFNRSGPDSEGDWLVALLSTVARHFTLGLGLTLYGALWIVAFFLSVWSVRISTGISTRIFESLRQDAMESALRNGVHLSDSSTNAAGNAAWSISRGAEIVWKFVVNALPMGQVVIGLAVALFVVFQKSILVGLLCLGAILLRLALSRKQASQLLPARKEIEESRNKLAADTDEIISQRELILVHEREPHYLRKLRALTQNYGKQDRATAIWQTRYDSYSEGVNDLGMLVLLFGIVLLWSRGNDVASVGDAYFFVALYRRLQFPATRLLNFYDGYRESESVVQTFLRLLSPSVAVGVAQPNKTKSQDADGSSAVDIPRSVKAHPAIDFEGVQFSYGAERILEGCSFEIPKDKTTLLVGSSGSGKTTILRMCLGFLRPQSGSVLVHGLPTETPAVNQLHSLMSYSNQQDHVLDESVLDTLRWSGADITESDCKLALRRSGLRDIELTRSAKTLSIGQQQRLVFARLLLDNAPVLLLDEPFTGLDVFTLQDLDGEMQGLFRSQKRTIVMVSHRLNFVAFADHVILLDRGRVVEQGAPDELLTKSNGAFAALYGTTRAETRVQMEPAEAKFPAPSPVPCQTDTA